MLRVFSPTGFRLNIIANIGFESGFTGFIGLTITSPVRVGRLILNGAFITRPPAAALRIGEKK